MVRRPSASRRAISSCLRRARALGPRRRAATPRLSRARAARTDSSKGTSRTQRLTELRETPGSAAISPSVHAWARSARARACSWTLPRYPTPPCWRRGVTPAGRDASGALEVLAQLLRAVWVAQLGQRLRLDLADALAGHA